MQGVPNHAQHLSRATWKPTDESGIEWSSTGGLVRLDKWNGRREILGRANHRTAYSDPGRNQRDRELEPPLPPRLRVRIPPRKRQGDSARLIQGKAPGIIIPHTAKENRS